MDETPNLDLPYIMASQAQKHVTHNEAIRTLDAIVQLSVRDRDLSSPPASPANGERYIIGASAGGDWSGEENRIAAWQDNAWMFHAPLEGWLAWVEDEDILLVWDGAAWVEADASINPAPLLGVNTTAADPNKLAVKSDAILFSHDDVTPGSGDIQTVLNKKNAAGKATFLFQSNWSGRAEIGLAGDDDFHFKVSPDGSSWHEGITIDKDTGFVAFPSGGVREALRADRTYHVNTATGNNSNDGLSAGTALASVNEAIGRCYKIDSNGHGITIKLADGTYSGGFSITAPIVGGARLNIIGNSSAPANVIITNASSTIKISGGAKIAIRHMKLENSGSWSLIDVKELSDLYYDNIVFSSCSRYHLEGTTNSNITIDGDSTITGGAVSHLYMSKGATFTTINKTVTVTGTPNFSGAFVKLVGCSSYRMWNMLWSGAATGKRYDLQYNSTCNGGSATHFPGDVAGTTTSGGQYGY